MEVETIIDLITENRQVILCMSIAQRCRALESLTLKSDDLIVLKVSKGISLEDVLQNGYKCKRHLFGKTHYYRLKIDSAYEDIACNPQKCPKLILQECDKNGKVFGNKFA